MNRRDFLRAAAAGPLASLADTPDSISLDGTWLFREDTSHFWSEVSVPHTWQTSLDHFGVAWYRKTFHAPASWDGKVVRLEFEAVYHSAIVWVNDKPVGEHLGKGYTAFTLDITSALRRGANTILVKVDNAFSPNMLPRGNSFDWTPDGGIYRPVRLLVTPKIFIERVDVDAQPDLRGNTTLDINVVLSTKAPFRYAVIDDASGDIVFQGSAPRVQVPKLKLWHFDHPQLYRLQARAGDHEFTTTFGVRKIEVKDCGLYLNGDRVWLMGVERMGGSHPEFGMAEPGHWIRHDHDDMKELNCVFTRVHWQQDRRVLDYCDRYGMLIQVEVPTWGGATFRDPSPEILRNGLDQLREMIRRDRNHPSVVSWGLCNEINGQNPPAREFARALYAEARKLDPNRMRSYASNSLQQHPERDVAGEMDFIEWNEYYESWSKGTVADMERNLEEIHRAFPGKMIVISEYGYCECTPERTGGDAKRIEILRTHNAVLRRHDYVGGAIFFSYNDYRTHIGDKGIGALKQRVHGVVDLYGARKPSFEALRRESSPIESLEITGEGVRIRARQALPAYKLTGYKLRVVAYGAGDIPLERHEAAIPDLEPGGEIVIPIPLKGAQRLRIDVVRPTGFSAATLFANAEPRK